MAAPTKKYGLIRLEKKEKKAPAVKASIFGDDSDDDSMAAVNRMIDQTSKHNKVKRQTQMEIDKALADDPTVYAYDEVYDDLKKEEKEVAAKAFNSKPTEKKSRYITGLLKASEKRKKEHERREEKKVQKEREEEGDEFAEKEQFVTSAYKKKMAEMAAAEEEERRKEALEEMNDVTKQADMGGFYRSLYNQTLRDKPGASDKKDIKQEKEDAPLRTDAPDSKPKREYRRRVSSEEESDHDLPSDRNRHSREDNPQNNRNESNSKHRDRSRERRDRFRKDDRSRDRTPDGNDRYRGRDPADRRSMKSKDDDGYRERRRDRDEDGDRRKDRDRRDDRERRRGRDDDRSTERHKDTSHKDDRSNYGDDSKHSDNSSKATGSTSVSRSKTAEKRESAESLAEPKKYSKRNDSESVQSARERYLARKRAKEGD